MMRLHVLSFAVAAGGFIAAGVYVYKNRVNLIFADDENALQSHSTPRV